MKFKYTALTSNNQKVDGVLEGESPEKAKEALHKMALSIIAVSEISEEEAAKTLTTPTATDSSTVLPKSAIQVFSFKACDLSGKAVEGTIDAETDYSAYKRLNTEYNFVVLELYPMNSPQNIIDQTPFALKALETRMRKEGIEPLKREKNRNADGLGSHEINHKLVTEVDDIIKIGREIIEKNSHLFNTKQRQNIEKTVNNLERIRTSNNAKHILEMGNRILELLQNPEKGKMADLSDNYQKSLKQLRNSGFFNHHLKFSEKNIGLKRIKIIFDRIRKRFGFLQQKSDALKPGKLRKWWWHRLFTAKLKSTPSAIQSTPMVQNSLRTFPGQNLPQTAKKNVSPKILKRDFTSFFVEINSFISWLLFFYIVYFFLVGFSIEKNIGLPYPFIVKTLQGPLIIVISFFLLFTHFLLRLKIQFFRQNGPGSAFLFFFGYGLFIMMALNI